MKQTYTIILVLLSLIVFGQTPKKINHVLIIDKSGSMVGKGDGNGVVIWNDVKAALKSYINDVNTGDKITIYQFHAFLLDPVEIEIKDKNRDLNKAKELIDKINPDGVHTYMKKAVKTVLENYDFLNSNGIYDINLGIYTDGIDNSSDISFEEICKLYRIKKGERDFAYYISIGKNVPKEVSDQNDIVVAPNVNPKDIIATQEKLKRDDSIAKAIVKRKQDSIAKIKQDSMEKAKAKADSIEAIFALNKKNCIDQGGTWDCDENNNCECDMPMSLMQMLFLFGGLIIVIGIIIIILYYLSKFPKGIIQISGSIINKEVSLKGMKSFSLKRTLIMDNIEINGDVVLSKKLFSAYQGPVIKNIEEFPLFKENEPVSKGDVILPDETLTGMSDVNGNQIKLYYTH